MAGDSRSQLGNRPAGDRAARGVAVVGDALLFLALLLMSALIIVLIALTAPFAIALSAVTGMATKNRARRGWRAAPAG